MTRVGRLRKPRDLAVAEHTNTLDLEDGHGHLRQMRLRNVVSFKVEPAAAWRTVVSERTLMVAPPLKGV